ncbi:XylR family transcriptional regulator [Aeoliella sp. ICT_H6.2]|uniref:XylR family transcriptional regulator n=1 Tax=Aeoliella straminimaris TaxID=2954799 RepID=A0A9X2FCC9_9BACT|nr:XylR family transcriptional regulator [Aeoliella straminimaris]MCO6043386.1 XylR family transcriptional regulator [Aeoliella straminimaris]
MLPKVAVVVESSRSYGRNILRGIAAYSRSHGPFSIYRHDQGLAESVPDWLDDWEGDGIIARIESEELGAFLTRRDIPTVDLRYRFPIPNIPTIETDEASVAQLACDHLIACGIKNFAFCGFEGADYSNVRQNHAVEYLKQCGYSLNVYNDRATGATATVSIESAGLVHERELGEWLQSLPKPTGLWACNDVRAAQVLNVCREYDISVPDEIAVLGVDDDRLICELTTPSLSSVVLDPFRVGYLAAEALAKMMKGTYPAEPSALVRAKGILSRQSTNLLNIDDAEVATAINFIRDHACEGITVVDVANAIHVSRSTLARRFAKFTGSTVKAEITRVRINRLKQLLADTEYSLAKIANMVGFAHVEYMSTMFKEHTGETPGQYRRLHQRFHATLD